MTAVGRPDRGNQPAPERRIAIAPQTLVTIAGLAFGGILAIRLVQAIRGTLTQLVVAVVLAMALEPLVQACERRGLRRSHAVGVAFGLVIVFVALLAWLVVPPLAAELTRFARDQKTSVSGTGTTKWTVKLKKGTYHFVCDPHRTIMHGVLKVT